MNIILTSEIVLTDFDLVESKGTVYSVACTWDKMQWIWRRFMRFEHVTAPAGLFGIFKQIDEDHRTLSCHPFGTEEQILHYEVHIQH